MSTLRIVPTALTSIAAVCTDDGFFGALDVDLEEPLGDRDVVDLSERRADGE